MARLFLRRPSHVKTLGGERETAGGGQPVEDDHQGGSTSLPELALVDPSQLRAVHRRHDGDGPQPLFKEERTGGRRCV
jgi:hypothetical protein